MMLNDYLNLLYSLKIIEIVGKGINSSQYIIKQKGLSIILMIFEVSLEYTACQMIVFLNQKSGWLVIYSCFAQVISDT